MSSHFGELDTTPTSRHLQSTKQKANSRSPSDEFDQDLGDEDMLQLDAMAAVCSGNQTQPWSEEGSQTHRSSPAIGQTPKDIWDFGNQIENDGSSLPPLSSPKSGLDNLPDTVPIPPGFSPDTQQPVADARSRFDLSETASTMRRSSPFGLEPARNTIWDLLGDSPDREFPDDHGHGPTTESISPTNNAKDTTPTKQSPHESIRKEFLHPDAVREIRGSFDSLLVIVSPVIDLEGALEGTDGQACRRLDFESEKDFVASPPKSAGLPIANSNDESLSGSQTQPCGAVKVPGAHASPQMSTPSPPTKPQQRGKKRKQRAKTPIQFDENTQVVEGKTQVKRKAPRIDAATATLDKSLPSKPSPVIPAKRVAANNSSQPKKKRKGNFSKQSPKKQTAISAQSTKATNRTPPQKSKQTALTKRKSQHKRQQGSASPAGRGKLKGESPPSEIGQALSSPGHREESPKLTKAMLIRKPPDAHQVQYSGARSSLPVSIKNGKGMGGSDAFSKYPIYIPSDSSSSFSSPPELHDVPSPTSKPITTQSNLKTAVRGATTKSDPHDGKPAPTQKEIPDSDTVNSSIEEYQNQSHISSGAKEHYNELRKPDSPRPKLVTEKNVRNPPLGTRNLNMRANQNKNKTVNRTAAAPLASSTIGRVLRSTSAEAKKQLAKETVSVQGQAASHQPTFMGKVAYNGGSGSKTGFQKISRGRQKIKEPEVTRTLSISEDGSPVRLQRSRAGELVSPVQIGDLGSSDSDEQNQALVREGGIPNHRKVRRQLVFTNSQFTARNNLPTASESTREAEETSLWPGEPKHSRSRAKISGVKELPRALSPSFQFADIKDKIRTQISTSFHEQRQAEEMRTHEQGANSHKTGTKGRSSLHSYDHNSSISRELHGIVDVSSPHFRTCG